MGLEARCPCTWQGAKGVVRAHLDSTGLDLKGAHRLHLDLSEITEACIKNGALQLQTRKGVVLLEIPDRVEAWVRNISNPRSRIDKLGVKAGSRVMLAGGVSDAELMKELVSKDCTLLQCAGKASLDAIFVFVEQPKELQDLRRYRSFLRNDGSIWVVRKKGKDASVTEAQVRAAAEDAGLVDIKIVAFSASQSAEKLVVPRAQRARGQPAATRICVYRRSD